MKDTTHVLSLASIPSCQALDNEIFLKQFGKPNKPFVLKAGIRHTPAMGKWTWDFLREKFGSKEIVVYKTGNRNDYKIMRFNDYIDYIHTTEEEDPYYLLDWFVEQNCPELRADYEMPSYFQSWADRLPTPLRPHFLAFYIGPKNSASPLHIDIMSTSAWNAVFQGQKLWVFYPPEQANLVYRGKVNPFQPDYEKFPQFKKAQGMFCLQEAGDVVFTPSGWWHSVLNTEHCISLTDNFINSSNIQRFFTRFFPATGHLIKRTWKRRNQIYNR